MSRTCACRRLERLLDDPRLVLLPLAARGLLVALVHAMAKLPDPAVFAWGLHPGSLRELALMIRADETEVETHVETLVQTGLLARRGDGALMLPAEAASPRAGIGGRPRKGETAEQARERRQGHLKLPIPGGAETRETRLETPDETSRARGLLASSNSFEAAAGSDAREDFAELGEELAAIAGMDPSVGAHDFGVVKAWRQVPGATPGLLREVVRQVAARESYPTPAPRSLRYFDKPVRDAARAAPPPAAPADPERAAAMRDYERKLAAWQRDPYGDPPAVPACFRSAA